MFINQFLFNEVALRKCTLDIFIYNIGNIYTHLIINIIYNNN
jgi:hypothetical protein